MSHAPSALHEELHNLGQYGSVKRVLRLPKYTDHLDRPLAYWVLPDDRQLPMVFLSRTVGDLLKNSYEDLWVTRGVGSKKMAMLITLLNRVAETNPAEFLAVSDVPNSLGKLRKKTSNGDGTANLAPPFCSSNSEDVATGETGFDWKSVSELYWSQWRSSVMRHGLGDEKLGRFTPSLQGMTKVLWNLPLAKFAPYTLAELQAMETYGKKRIRAIVEVFYCAHKIVSGLDYLPHMSVKILSRSIASIEQWVGLWLQKTGVPDENEIFERLVSPLLEQVRLDASPQMIRVAESRVGISDPPASVRQTARQLDITRARVYQLLDEINDMMKVRWPLGRHQVYELRDKIEREAEAMDNPPNLDQFNAALELLYPNFRRGADGSIEFADEGFQEAERELVEV